MVARAERDRVRAAIRGLRNRARELRRQSLTLVPPRHSPESTTLPRRLARLFFSGGMQGRRPAPRAVNRVGPTMSATCPLHLSIVLQKSPTEVCGIGIWNIRLRLRALL